MIAEFFGRVLSGLSMFTSRDPDRRLYHDVVIGPGRKAGTYLHATDGRILAEVRYLNQDSPVTFRTAIPPELQKAGVDVVGKRQALVTERDGALSIHGMEGEASKLVDHVGMTFPDLEEIIETQILDDRMRRVTLDLHVLGKLIDGLRRMHLLTPQHEKKVEKVLLHLLVLSEDKPVAFEIDDRLRGEFETRGAICPVMHAGLHPVKGIDLRRGGRKS